MCERGGKPPIHDVVAEIVCHLVKSGNSNGILHGFGRLQTDAEQINYAYDLLKSRNLLICNSKMRKSSAEALRLRQLGNQYFKARDYDNALRAYTKSAFYAEEGDSNLSIAYANRSAVLFENRRYRECLIDINNAERNNYPSELKEKLTGRRAKAESLIPEEIVNEYHYKTPIIATPNPYIECASNCLEIKYLPLYGRHVIATRRIGAGEIIAVENPFVQILLKTAYDTHCYACLRHSYNLVPCKSCVQIGFCSERCRDECWSYHKHECLVIDTLLELGFAKLVLIALRIVLVARNPKRTAEAHDRNLYRSANYEEIGNLCTNHELRDPQELLQRCMIVALVYDLVKGNTNVLRGKMDEERFKAMLLKHYEAASSNFHEISELVVKRDRTYEIVEIGSGAYTFLSLLNHSCAPNVVRHCYGKTIVLRALKPIERGEQILDNYGYHHALMGRIDRQKHLRWQYLFDCRCVACTNDWPLFHVNLPDDGRVDIDEDITKRLLMCDRNVAIDELPRLLKYANELDMYKPTKSVLEIQEYIKHCYTILGNKRHLL